MSRSIEMVPNQAHAVPAIAAGENNQYQQFLADEGDQDQQPPAENPLQRNIVRALRFNHTQKPIIAPGTAVTQAHTLPPDPPHFASDVRDPGTINWISDTIGAPRKINHASGVVGNTIWLLGGYSTGINFKQFSPIDVYALNTITYRWTQVDYLKMEVRAENFYDNYIRFYGRDIPYMRYGHTACGVQGQIYVWGGRNDVRADNKMFLWSPSRQCWKLLQTHGVQPARRDGHACCNVSDSKFAIFGGFEEISHRFSQDLYIFDVPSLTWRFVSVSNPPPHRDFSGIACIKETIYLFGGRCSRSGATNTNEDYYPDDFYSCDLSTVPFQWKIVDPQLSPSPDGTPDGRRSLSVTTYNEKMYIFGGFSADKGHYNDFWRYDPADPQSGWRKIFQRQLAFHYPLARRRPQVHIVRGVLFLFGGTTPFTVEANKYENWRLRRAARPYTKNYAQRPPTDPYTAMSAPNRFRLRDLNDMHVGMFDVPPLKIMAFRKCIGRMSSLRRWSDLGHADHEVSNKNIVPHMPRGLMEEMRLTEMDNQIAPYGLRYPQNDVIPPWVEISKPPPPPAADGETDGEDTNSGPDGPPPVDAAPPGPADPLAP